MAITKYKLVGYLGSYTPFTSYNTGNGIITNFNEDLGTYNWTKNSGFIGIETVHYQKYCNDILVGTKTDTFISNDYCIQNATIDIIGSQIAIVNNELLYNIEDVTQFTNYTINWTITNGIIVSGQGTTQVRVKFTGKYLGTLQAELVYLNGDCTVVSTINVSISLPPCGVC